MKSELTPDDFCKLVADIARLNSITQELAADYMLDMADTPETDAQGLAIIRDDQDKEIARIHIPTDEE